MNLPDLPAQLVVRSMVEGDLTAVEEIDRLSLPSPTKANLYRYEITENELAHYHVLDRDGEVVGFAGYWMLAGEAHISMIAVNPSERRRGYGELLLLHLLYHAAGLAAQVATLEVRTSNVGAQALYQKYRFAVVGERRRYYRDTGEDALIMTGPPLDAAYGRFLDEQKTNLLNRLRIA